MPVYDCLCSLCGDGGGRRTLDSHPHKLPVKRGRERSRTRTSKAPWTHVDVDREKVAGRKSSSVVGDQARGRDEEAEGNQQLQLQFPLSN